MTEISWEKKAANLSGFFFRKWSIFKLCCNLLFELPNG
jgi:hypothetical protein